MTFSLFKTASEDGGGAGRVSRHSSWPPPQPPPNRGETLTFGLHKASAPPPPTPFPSPLT